MRCFARRSQQRQALGVACATWLLLFVHGLNTHSQSSLTITEAPTPSKRRLPVSHWRRQDDAEQSYSSTTTVVVTATHKSSSGGSSDDDGGSNTSQTAWIIAGSGVGALALIGGIFYFATKDKDLNWMDLLSANKNNEGGGGGNAGSEMGQMGGGPPPSMGPMSNFGGMPPQPQGDPFGGAGSAPMGPMPEANPFDPGFSNQPVPQAGSFAPQFPPQPLQQSMPPQPMPPPAAAMRSSGLSHSKAGSGSSSSSSSASSSRGGNGRKPSYEKSSFSVGSYNPTIHHDRAHSPEKSQFFAPSAVSGGYAVTSVSRMYDVNGNRINVNKKDDERGNASAFSPSETGYGMPRSRAGMPASKSTISKSLRRLSGGSGATGLSFRSGRTGRSAGTGISATSFGKKSAPSSYAPTSVSRNVPRKVDDATSFTGRSYSSSRLAPRSLGRTAPLSVKSGRSSRRRGFDEESAFSDETDGSDARSRGSSALTSRTAGTRLGGSTFKSSAFSGKSSALRGGLKLSKSDYSRSGFTSSAGPGKGSRKIPRPRDSRGLSDIDEEESEVLLDEPSSYAGRDYVRGGAGSSTLAPNSRTGITLAASDLTGTSYNGSGIPRGGHWGH